MQFLRSYIILSFIMASFVCATAQNIADTVAAAPTDTVPAKKGLIAKIIDYFDDANKPKKQKKFDIKIGRAHV